MIKPKKPRSKPGTVVPPSGQPPSGNLAPLDSKRLASELSNYYAEYAPLFARPEHQGNRPIRSRIRGVYIQDFKQIASIPTGLQSLGLNAAFQCCFLL